MSRTIIEKWFERKIVRTEYIWDMNKMIRTTYIDSKNDSNRKHDSTEWSDKIWFEPLLSCNRCYELQLPLLNSFSTRLNKGILLDEIAQRNPSLQDDKNESFSTRLHRGSLCTGESSSIRLPRGILLYKITQRNPSLRDCTKESFTTKLHGEVLLDEIALRNPSSLDHTKETFSTR